LQIAEVWVYLIGFTSSRNRTLICGPSGCSGDCDGHPPGTIICEYDESCVGSLTASIENPPNGSHFFSPDILLLLMVVLPEESNLILILGI